MPRDVPNYTKLKTKLAKRNNIYSLYGKQKSLACGFP
jgi:hypothetical protein